MRDVRHDELVASLSRANAVISVLTNHLLDFEEELQWYLNEGHPQYGSPNFFREVRRRVAARFRRRVDSLVSKGFCPQQHLHEFAEQLSAWEQAAIEETPSRPPRL